MLSHELDGVNDGDEMELQVDLEGGYVSDGTGYRRASSSRNKLVRSLGSVNYNEMMVLDTELNRDKKKRKNTGGSSKKKGKARSRSRRGKRAGSDGEAEFQFDSYSDDSSSTSSDSDSDSSGSESESDWRDPSWVIDENEEEERRKWAEDQKKKKAEDRTKKREKRRTLTTLPSDDNTTGALTPTAGTTPTITPSSTPPTSSSREGSEESGSNTSTPRSPKKLDKRFSLRRFKEKTTINNPSIKQGSQTARDSSESLDQQHQQDVLHQSPGFTEVRKGRVKKSLWSVRTKKKKSGSYIGNHKCRSEGDPEGLNGNHSSMGNIMSTSPKSPFKNFLYSLGGKNRGRSISCTTSPQLRKDTSDEYLDASSLRSRSVSVAY